MNGFNMFLRIVEISEEAPPEQARSGSSADVGTRALLHDLTTNGGLLALNGCDLLTNLLKFLCCSNFFLDWILLNTVNIT